MTSNVVPALMAHGLKAADARNYAPIGCIELTVPGRANPHAVSGWFNSTKCLELALYDGVDPRSGEQLGPRTVRMPLAAIQPRAVARSIRAGSSSSRHS